MPLRSRNGEILTGRELFRRRRRVLRSNIVGTAGVDHDVGPLRASTRRHANRSSRSSWSRSSDRISKPARLNAATTLATLHEIPMTTGILPRGPLSRTSTSHQPWHPTPGWLPPGGRQLIWSLGARPERILKA